MSLGSEEDKHTDAVVTGGWHTLTLCGIIMHSTDSINCTPQWAKFTLAQLATAAPTYPTTVITFNNTNAVCILTPVVVVVMVGVVVVEVVVMGVVVVGVVVVGVVVVGAAVQLKRSRYAHV